MTLSDRDKDLLIALVIMFFFMLALAAVVGMEG